MNEKNKLFQILARLSYYVFEEREEKYSDYWGFGLMVLRTKGVSYQWGFGI